MTEVSQQQQTQNVADGLRIAFTRYVDDYRTLPILGASIELACKRLAELQARSEELENAMCVQSIAEVVSEYLVRVNEEHANDEGIMFIPPTAIPWLSGGIAKRIVERRNKT